MIHSMMVETPSYKRQIKLEKKSQVKGYKKDQTTKTNFCVTKLLVNTID